MNRKAIDYGVLERDVESNKQIYQTPAAAGQGDRRLRRRCKTSNIRIVDAAEATTVDPVSPRRLLNLLGRPVRRSCSSASWLAFLFEYLDNRIKTPEEIENALGLASLGLIPMLAPTPGVCGERPAHQQRRPANFSEAFRGLRTNVLFSSADRRPAGQSWLPARDRARARPWSPATWRIGLAHGRPACVADRRRHAPASGSRACSNSPSSRGCRTCWSAPPSRARWCGNRRRRTCG